MTTLHLGADGASLSPETVGPSSAAELRDAVGDWLRQPAGHDEHHASGDGDCMLRCVAPDLKSFQAFVAQLTAAPAVRNVRTALIWRTIKDAPAVPMEEVSPGY